MPKLTFLDISNNNAGDSLITEIGDLLKPSSTESTIKTIVFDGNNPQTFAPYQSLIDNIQQRPSHFFCSFPVSDIEKLISDQKVNPKDVGHLKAVINKATHLPYLSCPAANEIPNWFNSLEEPLETYVFDSSFSNYEFPQWFEDSTLQELKDFKPAMDPNQIKEEESVSVLSVCESTDTDISHVLPSKLSEQTKTKTNDHLDSDESTQKVDTGKDISIAQLLGLNSSDSVAQKIEADIPDLPPSESDTDVVKMFDCYRPRSHPELVPGGAHIDTSEEFIQMLIQKDDNQVHHLLGESDTVTLDSHDTIEHYDPSVKDDLLDILNEKSLKQDFETERTDLTKKESEKTFEKDENQDENENQGQDEINEKEEEEAHLTTNEDADDEIEGNMFLTDDDQNDEPPNILNKKCQSGDEIEKIDSSEEFSFASDGNTPTSRTKPLSANVKTENQRKRVGPFAEWPPKRETLSGEIDYDRPDWAFPPSAKHPISNKKIYSALNMKFALYRTVNKVRRLPH